MITEEYSFLLANGYLGMQSGHYFAHLSQPIGVWNYLRLADTIARQAPHARLLDWGCGYGQMTYLLRRRGLHVTPYDIGTAETAMPDIPLCRGLEIVRGLHPTALPFADGTFDAVLSCGVLEHVDEHSAPGNETHSLREIARVLRLGGKLLIYQLPQQYAWQEAMLRRLRRGYAHPRRYTASEISRMLRDTGYRVDSIGRANLFPRNLTGIPGWARGIYNACAQPILAADTAFCRVPWLNQLAGVLEVVAVRTA